MVQVAFANNPLDYPPTWTDISPYVRSISIRRGRQRELDRIEAGTATVVLDNRDRRFDPAYTGSPYYPNVVPMKRIRIGATWGTTTYWLFTGFVDSWAQEWPAWGDIETTVSCSDLFKAFALHRIRVDAPQELSGARINRVLDLIGWPAGERLVDAGQSQVQAGTIDEQALSHLQAVAEAEQGMLFIAGDGKVVFRNRHARILATLTAAPVFGDGPGELPYASLTFEYTDDQLWNHVIVQRAGSSAQAEVNNPESQTAYLRRTLEKRGLLITSDAEAQAAAEYLANRYSRPQLVIRTMTIQPEASDALWPQTLGRELGDRVIVRRRPLGGAMIEQTSFVEGISWDINPDTGWKTTWQLSPADIETFWILAGTDTDQYAPYSKLEQTTRLAY